MVDIGIDQITNFPLENGLLTDDFYCYIQAPIFVIFLANSKTRTSRTLKKGKMEIALDGNKTLHFTFEECNDDEEIEINWNFFEKDYDLASSTGLSCIWEGSFILLDYLKKNPSVVSIHNKKILELGSGCGFLGMALAYFGQAQVVLTDTKTVVENATGKNIRRNCITPKDCESPFFLPLPSYTIAQGSVAPYVLDWNVFPNDSPLFETTTEKNQFDILVSADCIWLKELLPPFCKVLHAFLSARLCPFALLCFPVRGGKESKTFSTQQDLLNALQNVGLQWEILEDIPVGAITSFSPNGSSNVKHTLIIKVFSY